jgi:hypothetical protein
MMLLHLLERLLLLLALILQRQRPATLVVSTFQRLLLMAPKTFVQSFCLPPGKQAVCTVFNTPN